MTTPLITDHVFRSFKIKVRPSMVGLCAYMSCGRTREEHARAVTGDGRARWSL